MTVVSSLRSFSSQATVEALAAELYRVPSSNATRRYLTVVLETLTGLPRDLWEPTLVEMAHDAHFSLKWRRKFDAVLYGS
jgi:hypothetical protein